MPTLPYVPEAYDYGPTSRIAEMMLRAAQQQAQARYANAENLGRGIANAGQAIGDVLQQRQASQQQAAQQAELGRQDAALFALMEQNPDAGLVDYVRIAGPDRGAKVFQAQAAARKMTTVPPDQALKLLPIALDGYFAIPPGPGRARAYDNLRQVAGQSGLPVQGFPEQWDEQADQILADVQSRLRAQGEGVAQVDTVDDAGNPVTRFVPKQAGASYAKPKPEPRLDSRGFEARIADAVARGDMAAAESLRQEAGRLAAAGRAPQQVEAPKVGTLEAYTIGKFGPRPTPEQQLQARREFEASGAAASGGGEDAKRAESIMPMLSRMHDLSGKIINTSGITQKVKSAGRGVAASFGHDADFQVYQDLRNSLASMIAVATQGSRPSDADVFRAALPLVPDPYKDTAESAAQKWANIYEMFETKLSPEAKARIGLAAGGTSGFDPQAARKRYNY